MSAAEDLKHKWGTIFGAHPDSQAGQLYSGVSRIVEDVQNLAREAELMSGRAAEITHGSVAHARNEALAHLAAAALRLSQIAEHELPRVYDHIAAATASAEDYSNTLL